jgi:tetratricopeptide (TPR) repeat protein
MQGNGITEERALSDEQARLHFRAGVGLYDAGRFPQAAEEFEEAFRLSGRPQLLFNAYVAYRDANDVAGAARCLEGYLRGTPDVEDRVNLEARLRSMREALAEEASRAALLAENERRLAESQALQRGPEVWPWVIAGTGAAMMLGGAVTGGLALSEADALVAACPGGECAPGANLAARRSNAQTLATATDALVFGGAAIALTGVVLGLVLMPSGSDADERSRPTVGAGCTDQGCSATVSGRF